MEYWQTRSALNTTSSRDSLKRNELKARMEALRVQLNLPQEDLDLILNDGPQEDELAGLFTVY